MKKLFEQTVDVIEREFYESHFLAKRWSTIKNTHAQQYGQAGSVEEKETVIKSLLESLGVSHSMLINPQLAEYIVQEEEKSGESLILKMQEDILFAHVLSFQVRGMRGEAVHRLAELASTASAVVLDLRLNSGGSGSAVVELASLFLSPETPVLQMRDRLWQEQKKPYIIYKLPKDENIDHALDVGLAHQHHWVEYRTIDSPYKIGRDKPLIVLTDEQCYSCGEIFVQCMKEHSWATIVGQKTAGFVVAAEQHELDEGYSVLVPFAEMLSGKGKTLEGTGVEPDFEVDLSEATNEQIIEKLQELKLLTK